MSGQLAPRSPERRWKLPAAARLPGLNLAHAALFTRARLRRASGNPNTVHGAAGARRPPSQIDDQDPALGIFVRVRLDGRSVHVQRELEARLLRVRFSPLGFFASANLLDDERG
jgi:hypothetical protein